MLLRRPPIHVVAAFIVIGHIHAEIKALGGILA
jgi:hypothetical protein